jgi:hypothetical protein
MEGRKITKRWEEGRKGWGYTPKRCEVLKHTVAVVASAKKLRDRREGGREGGREGRKRKKERKRKENGGKRK